MSSRCLLTTVTCLLAAGLLLAILICALASSPNMREMAWIPSWLGEWADRNPNFPNMPGFAAFAALLFFVWNLLSPISDIRRLTSAKSLSLLILLVAAAPRLP